MWLLKRNMITLGDFEYIISNAEGCVAKIERVRIGTQFQYHSRGCSNDFVLAVNRKYENTQTFSDSIQNVAGYYNTVSGLQNSVMYCATKGRGFLKNYIYWSIMYDNRVYTFYEVGMRAEGTFYCVYLDGALLAMIRKDPVMLSRSTQYEIYAENFVPAELLFIFTAFLDLTCYYPNPNKSSKSTEYRNTPQKELIAKYDPTFIPRIKAMEGI